MCRQKTRKCPTGREELKEFLDTTMNVEDISEEIEEMQSMLASFEASPFHLKDGLVLEIAKLRTRLALAEDLRKTLDNK